MDNAREQVLGQFGSVTGPAKVLEVLQDGASFGHAVSAGHTTEVPTSGGSGALRI